MLCLTADPVPFLNPAIVLFLAKTSHTPLDFWHLRTPARSREPLLFVRIAGAGRTPVDWRSSQQLRKLVHTHRREGGLRGYSTRNIRRGEVAGKGRATTWKREASAATRFRPRTAVHPKRRIREAGKNSPENDSPEARNLCHPNGKTSGGEWPRRQEHPEPSRSPTANTCNM